MLLYKIVYLLQPSFCSHFPLVLWLPRMSRGFREVLWRLPPFQVLSPKTMLGFFFFFCPFFSLMPHIQLVRKSYWLYFQKLPRTQSLLTFSTATTAMRAISISHQECHTCLLLRDLPSFALVLALYFQNYSQSGPISLLKLVPLQTIPSKKKNLNHLYFLLIIGTSR